MRAVLTRTLRTVTVRSFLANEQIPDLLSYDEGVHRRPTLQQLVARDPSYDTDEVDAVMMGIEDTEAKTTQSCKGKLKDVFCPTDGVTKFGWWDGVALRDILNIVCSFCLRGSDI